MIGNTGRDRSSARKTSSHTPVKGIALDFSPPCCEAIIDNSATVSWNVDGSSQEELVDNWCVVTAADPAAAYLLGAVLFGERTGVYEVSMSDRKCIPLLPGVVTPGATFARDGKSFLYAVASSGEITIYRSLGNRAN